VKRNFNVLITNLSWCHDFESFEDILKFLRENAVEIREVGNYTKITATTDWKSYVDFWLDDYPAFIRFEKKDEGRW